MKSFSISKQVILEAYEQVKKNKGAAGVDSQSLEEFRENLRDNLYKIWNRMSSGTYFPPPVRAVAIQKDDGRSQRILGIPTVTDRIAQTVGKMHLEPLVEPYFHRDSYGYRPNKSAIDAVRTARERCWRNDWVIDLDIKGFFDNLDHELVMQSVKEFTEERWILLYIERWLKVPAQLADGTQIPRGKGTPQGGVISPLLANIFLHMAFDSWMQTEFPTVPFERYADDIIVHCKTEEQAKSMILSIEQRLAQYKLELHPKKTRIVCCNKRRRKESYPNEEFDFLGFTFRTRLNKSKEGIFFAGFNPAVSNKAKKSINGQIKQWKVHKRSDLSLEEIAEMANPVLQGWINYYGKFHRSALRPLFQHFNDILWKWVKRKYKRFRQCGRKARQWLERLAKREPNMFAHWPAASKIMKLADANSAVNGDYPFM